MPFLVLVLTLALVLAGLTASAAQAQGPSMHVTFTCTSVTFEFTGFPNAPNNTVAEKILVDGNLIHEGSFTFNGPSGSNTVTINLPAGKHRVKVGTRSTSNGVRFEKDKGAKHGLTCTDTKFEIKKLQKIFGSGQPFTMSELMGEVGETVDYEIIVKNTGNTSLKFSPLTDTRCENISPSGEVDLAAGGEQTYTCEHILTVADEAAGKHENSATTDSQTSNTVVVKVREKPKPSFTIEKLQEIAGSGKGFTKTELTTTIGQTVDYEVIVHNTGNTSLKFSKLTDANCEGISPSGEVELAAGAEQTYTCSHKLTTTGKYGNTGSITGNDGTGEKTSNEVVVNVPAEPSFTIEKLQEIAGSGKGFTKTELTTTIGQTVDYEVIVHNTGNTSLKFSKLTDANCEGISPSGEVELAAGAEQTYTCSHKLTTTGKYGNTGSITGNDGTGEKTSNEVVVNVPAEPSFTIEKLQEIAGSGKGFTKTELTTTIGQTVDYEVIVHNTGNTSLKFSKLTDANCEGISPSGEVELAAGAEQTYTCSHKLTTTGKYGNTGSITGNDGTGEKTSNEVVVNVPAEPSFTIEKLQEIAGSGKGFTKTELTTTIGQTVDYEVIVHNTGNTSLKFSKLTDANCEGISPSGEVELAAGAEQTYTCSHKLTTTGKYGNTGSITGNDGTGEKTSNEVVVNVPAEPSFTIEKLQEIAGSGKGFTKTELTTTIGQTVDYEVIVHNTGNTSLKFSKLTDANCEGISPSGEVELAAGAEQTYTCSHKLTTTGKYGNTGSITGNDGTGEKTSNEVVVNVPAEPSYTIEKEQKIKGEPGYTQSKLSATIGETVEYQIVVTNTGNVPLEFTSFMDSNCGMPTGGPTGAVEPGKSTTYKCSHELESTGTYTNEASVEDNHGMKQTSNKVEVSVKERPEPSFTIEKLQRIGAEGYSTKTKDGTVGQTVEYKIVVMNTGNVPLEFSKLTDAKCEEISPSGKETVPAGGKEEYTCKHVLTTADETAGSYTNEASITGNEGTGTKTSNPVVVEVPKTCPEKGPHQINARWHYATNGESKGGWSKTAEITCGKKIDFGPEAMEGVQNVAPGTEVKGGWDFTLPGENKEWTLTFATGKIIFRNVHCEKGETPSSSMFEIVLPEESYVSTNGADWYPSQEESAPSTFQGKVLAPALCGPHGENKIQLGNGGNPGGGTWESELSVKAG